MRKSQDSDKIMAGPVAQLGPSGTGRLTLVKLAGIGMDIGLACGPAGLSRNDGPSWDNTWDRPWDQTWDRTWGQTGTLADIHLGGPNLAWKKTFVQLCGNMS